MKKIIRVLSLLVLTTPIWIVSPSIQSQELYSFESFRETAAGFYKGCGRDIVKFCSTITVTPTRFIFCLRAHDDKLHPDCRQAIFDSNNNIWPEIEKFTSAGEQCWGDLERLCSKVDIGKGRLAQCLLDNKANLSAKCVSAIALNK